LECQLKIGEKYLVEITNGLLKENPRFGWYKLEDCPFLKDEDGNDTTTRKTTFTLGFDPEIGQPIIGKEYELTNTIDGRTSDKKGTAVPIKKSDALSGKLEFKILGIVGTQWDNITRRHPTLFRSTKWYHNMVNIMEHVSAIWIKDFKIDISSSVDSPGVIAESKNKDLLYTSAEERKYIKSKDDIDFKINSQVSSDEAKNLGLPNTTSVSNVIDLQTNLGLTGIYTYEEENSFNRPEKLYVD